MPESSQGFLKEYISFISKAGRHFPLLGWWATWVASKNRFNSPLQPYLESLYLGVSSNQGMPKADVKRALKYLGRKILETLYAKVILGRHYRRYKKKMASRPLYVIKTFSYGHCFKEQSFDDVFFGRLPGYLRDEKKLQVLTFLDPLGEYKKTVKGSLKLSGVFPYQVVLTFGDFIKAVFLWLKSARFKTPEKILFKNADLRDFINAQYRKDILSADGIHTYLMYFAVKRLGRDFKMSHFLMTWENNPWERLAQMALKEESPQTQILSYQHTVIPEASANMFPAEGELEWAPKSHKYLTVGEIPADLLKKYGDYGGRSLQSSCALRFEYLEELKPLKPSQRPSLLIALEGVPEAVKMLNYAIEETKSLAGVQVVIRTHPVLRFAALKGNKGKLGTDPSKLPHFVISETLPLLDDLKRASAVLYWGSTVALEALKLGLPIIHFNAGGLLSYDPLFEFTDYKWTVKAGDSLKSVLHEIRTMEPGDGARKQEAGRSYLAKYFHKVTSKELDKFL